MKKEQPASKTLWRWDWLLIASAGISAGIGHILNLRQKAIGSYTLKYLEEESLSNLGTKSYLLYLITGILLLAFICRIGYRIKNSKK